MMEIKVQVPQRQARAKVCNRPVDPFEGTVSGSHFALLRNEKCTHGCRCSTEHTSEKASIGGRLVDGWVKHRTFTQ